MLMFHDFLGKNYYDAMIILKEYNHLNNENIQFVIVKINNNVKFIKHVHIKSIFYINLECDDMDISNTLNEIKRILKPNGILRLGVPDFNSIVEYYNKTKDLRSISGLLYGGQDYLGNTHYWTWDFETLKNA